MTQLLREDPLAIRAVEFGREYMPLNMALRVSGQWNAAAISGLSRPAGYLLSGEDPEDLLAGVEYLARWDRAYHLIAGNLDEIVARYEDSPCLEVLWFVNNMARHDALGAPTSEFNGRVGKGRAKDLAHSDWWELCDLFWEIFTTPDESE